MIQLTLAEQIHLMRALLRSGTERHRVSAMNGQPVREIPMVPRRYEDTEVPVGYLGDDEPDGCTCDVPLEPGEETEDEHLPEARVPGLDKLLRGKKGDR